MKISKSISLKDRINRLKEKKLKKRVIFNLSNQSANESIASSNDPDASFISICSTAHESDSGNDVVDRANLPSTSSLYKPPAFISSSKKAKKRRLSGSHLVKNRSFLNTSLNDSNKLIDKTIKHDIDRFKKKIRLNRPSINNFLSEDFSSNEFNSIEFAEHCFKWLIHPYSPDELRTHCWEKKPLLLKRNESNYYGELFSTKELEKIIKENDLFYTRNIDIAIYEDNVRKTLNPDGKVYPALIWDKYNNGCSIRLLNPQTYSTNVWKICSILQEYFHSFVGANVYLTPPNSQGFAPHYDDIEAFILQLEGKKTWKVYAPLDSDTTLPRFSSKNFKPEDLNSEPLLVVDLEPGDLLYFPRGFIHEGKTGPDHHSLHITLSAAQKHSYGDLFEILMPQAIQFAMSENIEFRESLPLNYLNYMGVVNQEKTDKKRQEFLDKIKNLFSKLINHVNVDLAVDQFSKTFIHSALPPALTTLEKRLCIVEGGEKWADGEIEDGIVIELDTEIKLVRYTCCRLVVENDESVKLYHTLENSKVYQENELQYIEIPNELSLGVEHLINTYPNLCRVGDIPLDNLDDKLEVANLLFDKGLIVVNQTEVEEPEDKL